MSIDEARRLLLHDAARNASGADEAFGLMEMLPPTGWGDVATRQQLEAVEAHLVHRVDLLETRVGAEFERVDARFEQVDLRIDGLRFELRAEIAISQRRIIQWNVATLIAAVAAMTAIVRL